MIDGCLPLSDLGRFRHDPYPWQGERIYFAGRQACTFDKAELIESISGKKRWLLETHQPVWRVLSLPKDAPEELQRIKIHPTRQVWADECLLDKHELFFNRQHDTPNGSIVEIHEPAFTHIRRADFVELKAVLDRPVWLYTIYVDCDVWQSIQGLWRPFPMAPGAYLAYSTQDPWPFREVPLSKIDSVRPFRLEDYRYASATFDSSLRLLDQHGK